MGSIFIGRCLGKYLHPDDLIRAQNCFAGFLEHREGLYLQEFRMRHADGHYIWIESKGKILRDQKTNEPVEFVIGAHSDITEKSSWNWLCLIAGKWH